MGIYQDKREKTKKEIITAFWNVYERSESLRDVNIKNITQEAGIHRGTFYIHFEDVNALVREVEMQLLDSFEILNIKNDAFFEEERLEKCIKYMYENRRYYTILLSEKGDANFKTKLIQKFILIICPSYYEEKLSKEMSFRIEFIAGGMMNATLYCLLNETILEKEMIKLFYRFFNEIKNSILL